MRSTLPIAARWMLVSALALGGVALWRADSAAQTVAQARGNNPTLVARADTPHATHDIARVTPVTAVPGVGVPGVAAPRVHPTGTAVGGLRVRRFVVATGVTGREPVGASETFTAHGTAPLYAFAEVANAGEPTAIRVRFVQTDTPARASVGNVDLTVPTTGRYRTWAVTQQAHRAGTWAAVLETRDGQELARTAFTLR